jgi:hypothetical protein
MIDLTNVVHHPAIEEIVDVLCRKTQNTDRGFFRTEVAYFLAKMASNMRALIVTKDRGEIPVNIYAMALATSGYGKGHSVNIVESEFMLGFKKRFCDDTFNVIAEQHLWKIANERSLRNATDPQEEFDKVERSWESGGEFPYTFDNGTPEGVKQLRYKLLLSDIGAISYQVDEIGSNLERSNDVLNLFLELYDQGIVKQKLTKNTSENKRAEDRDGKTPSNMLLFGTPIKLLDGGRTEDAFYSMLETGYARRCLFGIGVQSKKAFNTQTPAEIYANLIQPANTTAVNKWAQHFHKLADPAMYGWKMTVPDDVAIELLTYKINCEMAADLMADHEEIRKAELSHRYFKALKLAGAYAFVDESNEVEMDHLKQAILLVEESGAAFQSILTREKAYVKLARYIADVDEEVTHADLVEKLAFYPRGAAGRSEMMSLAMGWGYKKHIIIKKTFQDGIEFFKGEKLKETDLSKLIIAYSDHWAYNYATEDVPFDQLHVLTQMAGQHWTNHAFKNGHRSEENVICGFNAVVIDVDHGTTWESAKELLKDYKFLSYTTKRHTDEANRFRIILPINYHLELDKDDYKEFMENVVNWLPFKNTDEEANQRSRKWASCEVGQYAYNMEGQILDALPFIPKTSKNADYKQAYQKVESLDNLERWFAQRIASGNRNNQMLKFALALVDSGLDLMSVSKQVHAFNAKLSNQLSETEIDTTILNTVAKRFQRH